MEKVIFKNGLVYMNNELIPCDVIVENGVILNIGNNLEFDSNTELIDCTGKYLLPGFTDVHVHFREPGFEYKETIKTGSMAALNGGYSNVCTMPNLNPVPDSLNNLNLELNKIKEDSVINIYPFGSITKEEKGIIISDMEDMAPYVIGYSDDGFGVQDYNIMVEAMTKAKSLNKFIASHCEVSSITGKGVINDGAYSSMHDIPGIPNESEYKEAKRNIEIAKATGCHLHICHVSCKETVDLVRNAKKEGIKVTCETGPHYLVLSELDMQDDGKYRFQPPLRTLSDRLALLEGIKDGTIDVIATDHAPHSYEEKTKGIRESANGIVGLECAFSILYTYLVKQKVITLNDLLKLMVDNPKKCFGIGSEIKEGHPAEFSVWNLEKVTKIDVEKFKSKGKFTPFDGKDVFGVRELTLMKGNRHEN